MSKDYETITEAFDDMYKRFRAQDTQGETFTYFFQINGWGNRLLTIKGDTMQLSEESIPNPDIVITVNHSDYLSIINGEVELSTAYMLGLVAIEGPVDAAERLAYFFPRPSKEVNQEGSHITSPR